MNKRLVQQGLPVILAVGLLWYVLKDVPLPELIVQFGQADYRWLALFAVLTTLYHLIRATRWQLVLHALGYHPSLFRTVTALLAGMLASMIVPGAGELTRCGTLQRTDDVPIAQGIGSVVAERVIDLFMLALLLGLTVALEFDRIQPYLKKLTPSLPGGYILIIGIMLVLIGGIIVWQVTHTPALREHSLTQRIIGVALGVKKGFLAIRQLANPGLFVTLTLLIQVLAWLTTYVLLFALPDTIALPPETALTILAVSSLGGMAVPTQGGIGTYHFLVSRVLVLYGLSMAQGAVAATFLHAVGFGISLLLSSVSFLVIPILITRRPAKPSKSLVK